MAKHLTRAPRTLLGHPVPPVIDRFFDHPWTPATLGRATLPAAGSSLFASPLGRTHQESQGREGDFASSGAWGKNRQDRNTYLVEIREEQD
jgi:hypothetical protein